MDLKGALFTMMFLGLLIAVVLSVAAFCGCIALRELVAPAGVVMDPHTAPPTVTYLPEPSAKAIHIANVLAVLQLVLPMLIFIGMTLLTSSLFYRIKLKEPLTALQAGAERIIAQDLDFTIPPPRNADELGRLCIVFEQMRQVLLQNNQNLWRQMEERKRLNAAFAHDLRNPITVLQGTIKLLKNGVPDETALNRMETYTMRIAQYIDTMSNIQRLEQLPIQKSEVCLDELAKELENTVNMLAPQLSCAVTKPDIKSVLLDHDLFMTAAENLIGNAARFAGNSLAIDLTCDGVFLTLSITDDGPGYPAQLLQNGPKPFGTMDENAAHFGMGLYTCQTLCQKHGGSLRLENPAGRGARATAQFKMTT